MEKPQARGSEDGLKESIVPQWREWERPQGLREIRQRSEEKKGLRAAPLREAPIKSENIMRR